MTSPARLVFKRTGRPSSPNYVNCDKYTLIKFELFIGQAHEALVTITFRALLEASESFIVRFLFQAEFIVEQMNDEKYYGLPCK